MALEAFPVIDTAHLTQRHPLPVWAPRSSLGRKDINGNVWAWFNPASIVWRGKRWLAYRTECSPRWHWSRVSLAELNDAFDVIPGTNTLLNLQTQYGGWGAEDPRLIVHEDRLFLSYSDGARVGLAELDEDGTVIRSKLFAKNAVMKIPALHKDDREKSWGFFSAQGRLFIVYWTSPHIVFAYDQGRRKLGSRWETEWNVPAS
ncbi:MAG: hypothetical protein WKF37_10430, partial [Bryobacteraceae bacterium]